MSDLQRQRMQMVEVQLAKRGVSDARVLQAFRTVPRELFVLERDTQSAYEDCAQPLTSGQTISQPYVVAVTAQALSLRGHERVLEVGTGSGYSAAILASLAHSVFSIERLPELAASAQARLARLGFAAVHVRCGDGTLGWPEEAPFDAIAVTAAGPAVPPALLAQLRIGGRLVMPIGPENGPQVLTRIHRESADSWATKELLNVRFVPLIGEHAFRAGLETIEQ